LIYYDQRGRGRSSRGVVPEDVDLESEIDDLERLRLHFGLESIALLGHSWGGLLAMEYATRHPQLVSRLLLVNSAPASRADLLLFRDHRQATEPEVLEKMRAISARHAFAAGEIEVEAEYYRAHFSSTLRRPEHLERIVQSLRLDFTPPDILKARAIEARLYAQTWLKPEYDLRPKLRLMETPALVIHGDRDLFPLDCARSLAESLPQSRLVLLNDCGHFSYLERPAEVQTAIADFFS
jgi:proline iminopeptidase